MDFGSREWMLGGGTGQPPAMPMFSQGVKAGPLISYASMIIFSVSLPSLGKNGVILLHNLINFLPFNSVCVGPSVG